MNTNTCAHVVTEASHTNSTGRNCSKCGAETPGRITITESLRHGSYSHTAQHSVYLMADHEILGMLHASPYLYLAGMGLASDMSDTQRTLYTQFLADLRNTGTASWGWSTYTVQAEEDATPVTSSTDEVTYQVCDSCTVVLANDDWSALDGIGLTEEEWNAERASMSASIEAMGLVTMGEELSGGYFSCWVCSMDSIGGHEWHGEARN